MQRNLKPKRFMIASVVFFSHSFTYLLPFGEIAFDETINMNNLENGENRNF